MSELFSTLIYQPILNLTVFFYSTVGFNDLGVAIVVMTIFIRATLLPFSIKTARSQRAMAELAPEIERIKQQHKGDTTAQSEAVMALYRERGVNPLSGCLPLLIQLPVLIGVYRVFLKIFEPESLNLLYAFIPRPDAIDNLTLGVLDISAGSPVLAITAGVAQYFQAKLSMTSPSSSAQAAAVGQQMMYLLPVMIVVISWNLPAGLAIYWIVTSLWSIGEQLYLRKA
jgi:YidC/Oxa1 family membrane protein insertase